MRCITRVIILLFIFFGFFPLFAQSTVKIKGTVFSADGTPLHGANVIVVGTGVGAATDANGHFAIENLFAGGYTLEASFVGYKSRVQKNVYVQKDLTATVHFRLTPVVIALDEITITAQQGFAETSDFLERIDLAQIQNSTARTVGELLGNLAGVDIINEGGGSGRKRISIRGSNTNQVLVLLDGVPLNDPLSGEMDLNQIPLSGVGEIRVLKGGNSSLYGNGAIGGVVEIISRRDAVDKVRLAAQTGQYGAVGIHPSVAGHIGGVQYFFSYQDLKEKGNYPYRYKRPDGTILSESRLNADLSSQNLFGKIAFGSGDHSFQLQTHLYTCQRGLPGLVFSWTPFADAKTNRKLFLGQYVFQNQKTSTRLTFSRYFNEVEFKNRPPADTPLRYRTVPSYHSLYRILTYRGNLESTYHFGRQQYMLFQTTVQGDDFEDKDLLTHFSGPIHRTDNFTYSAMLRNEWHLPKPAFLSDLVVNHALRYDFFSLKQSNSKREEEQFSPRIGVLFSHHNGWLCNVRANWGRSFRVPTFADLFYQDFRVKGNADLLPEESTDTDIGLQIGVPWFGWLEIGSNYFHHDIENLIVWELGSFATWRPGNTDARLQGWEWNGSWQFWDDRVELTLSHLVLSALDRSGQRTRHDKQLVYRPDYTTKLSLNFNFDKVALQYHRHLVGERYVTASNTVKQPPYSVDNLFIIFNHAFERFGMNAKLSLYNLFDERYEIVEHAPLPGRHWRIGMEIVF
jgi:outer membrane cobalamin receptor